MDKCLCQSMTEDVDDRCFLLLLQMSDFPKRGQASKTFLDQSVLWMGSSADGACQHSNAPPFRIKPRSCSEAPEELGNKKIIIINNE